MTSPRSWWRRAAEAVKDKRSICLTMVSFSRHNGLRNAEMEAAVIRATSHTDHSVDYKSASRVFALARTSPTFMTPLMCAVARRAERTRSWPVALKSLLIAHGLLLISSNASAAYNGRLPFDLVDFHDRDSSSNSWGFSVFVRAYFNFLDNRAILLSTSEDDGDDDGSMSQVDRLQTLLDLLMQIRPYADGMGVGLILEAMDCAVIEIFEVYSGICSGIASLLVGVFGSISKAKDGAREQGTQTGLKAISVLRRASEQSTRLTSYFEVCRSLGVLNAAEFPPVDRIPDEDILELERLVFHRTHETKEEERPEMSKVDTIPVQMCDLIRLEDEDQEEGKIGDSSGACSEAVITKNWVVFEDDDEKLRYYGNPFLCSPAEIRQWAPTTQCNVRTAWTENLIELM